MGYYSKMASAIYNDIYSGLRGYHTNLSLSLDQLEDEIAEERLQVIKEHILKGALSKKDLLMALNCINVDCESMEKCRCRSLIAEGDVLPHFEIPQLISDFGGGIEYIGSTDRRQKFNVYTSLQSLEWNKYRKRGASKPYVYVETTPNEHNLYDCWVFNAPFIKQVTVIGVFKDPRQLEEYGCCGDQNENMTMLDNEIKRRLTEKKIRWYRQYQPSLKPNDQSYQ